MVVQAYNLSLLRGGSRQIWEIKFILSSLASSKPGWHMWEPVSMGEGRQKSVSTKIQLLSKHHGSLRPLWTAHRWVQWTIPGRKYVALGFLPPVLCVERATPGTLSGRLESLFNPSGVSQDWLDVTLCYARRWWQNLRWGYGHKEQKKEASRCLHAVNSFSPVAQRGAELLWGARLCLEWWSFRLC